MKHRPLLFNVCLALFVALAAGASAPASVWAKSGMSSGGYARPGASARHRTAAAPVRTPSTSGGYRRPQASAASVPASVSGSATDRALARQSAKQALDAWRASVPPARDSESRSPASATQYSAPRRPSIAHADAPDRADQSAAWHRTPPWRSASATPAVAAQRSPTQFGPVSAVLLWGLLDQLSRPGHADFFYHHADDPALRQWRAEAETQAQDNPQVKQSLDRLDARIAEMREPRDPNYPLPATAAPARPAFPYGALLIALLLLLIGAIALIALWRRFYGDVGSGNANPFRRSARQSDRPKRQPDRPKWLRVGMTLPVDPSPFLLAAPYTALQAPEAATSSGLLSVATLGEAVAGELIWYRLHVSGGRGFFQVHLDVRGQPDECRYFSRLDEVVPGDAAEWGAWLDAHEGMIGWPEFQTKEGRVYRRLWVPGQTHVAPRIIEETLETDVGDTQRQRQQAMLYARATGAAAPAPPTEYLLVQAVEQDAAAWVEIHVGIDIPSAALQLG